MWAEIDDNGLRKIDNLPFLAFGISYSDLVKTSVASEGIEDFVAVVKKGGHSTYRLMPHAREISEDYLKQLIDLKCLYELGRIGQVLLISVSVPPDANIQEVYAQLEWGEREGIWDFEESNFEHSA